MTIKVTPPLGIQDQEEKTKSFVSRSMGQARLFSDRLASRESLASLKVVIEETLYPCFSNPLIKDKVTQRDEGGRGRGHGVHLCHNHAVHSP